MIWMFLLVITIAIALIKLGALTIWVVVLSTTLKLVALSAMALAVVWIARTLWRRAEFAWTPSRHDGLDKVSPPNRCHPYIR